MARKCACRKPRRPPTRAQRTYAAARRAAVSSCLSSSPGPGRPARLQLQPVKKKKKKGGGLASWLGGLQLVKGTSAKTTKERLSGSGSGYYDAGESISYGKDWGGTVYDKLSRVKG